MTVPEYALARMGTVGRFRERARRRGRPPSFIHHTPEPQTPSLDPDHAPELSGRIIRSLLRSIEANEEFAAAVRHLGEHGAQEAGKDPAQFDADDLLIVGLGYAGMFLGRWVLDEVL